MAIFEQSEKNCGDDLSNLLLSGEGGGEPLLDIRGHIVQLLQLILLRPALLPLLPPSSEVKTAGLPSMTRSKFLIVYIFLNSLVCDRGYPVTPKKG